MQNEMHKTYLLPKYINEFLEVFPYVRLYMHTHVVEKFKPGKLILPYKGHRGVAMTTYSLLAPG
jgi:hypothetical protein